MDCLLPIAEIFERLRVVVGKRFADRGYDQDRKRGGDVHRLDVRYAVFCGETDGKEVTVTHLIMTTDERFFSRFRKFGGKVLNKKL